MWTHGSKQAAHDIIAHVASEELSRQERRGLESQNDLLMADAIRRHDRCSDDAALKKLAAMKWAGEAARNNFVRNLRYWLKGKHLAQFSKRQVFVFTPPGTFSLSPAISAQFMKGPTAKLKNRLTELG
jgi:hypothetical protein